MTAAQALLLASLVLLNAVLLVIRRAARRATDGW
jgi:hypothetical protein